MRKRYGKIGAIGLALALCLSSASQAFAADGKTVNYSTVASVDFSDSGWSGFNGSGEFTQTDGTKLSITKRDGVNMAIKDSVSSDFVTDMNGAAKYLQYDATKGAGANVLTVTPQAALTEDFSFEFKAAGKRVNGTNVRYLSVVMVPEGAANSYGTTVMGWNGTFLYDTGTNGQSSRWPNNTTHMQLIIPKWSATQKYAISYGIDKLTSYKVDVHFNANGVPTFDLWGCYADNTGLTTDSDGRQLLLEGVKFADKDGSGKNNVDYSNGIGNISIELGSACDNEAIALADMKISKSKDGAEMNFDFENASYNAAFEQTEEQASAIKNTLKWNNGMSLVMNSKAKVNLTESGFVKNNAAGNKYLEVTATTVNKSDNNSELTLNFPQPMKQSFVTEYKFAIDAPYPTDSYNGYWAQNTNSIIFNAAPTGATWQDGSRVFYVLGNDRYGKPADTDHSTYAAGQAISGISCVSGQTFETIGVVTNYNGSGVPTADVYRKAYGKDYWQLVSKDIGYSKYRWNTTNAVNYSDGIGSISIRLDSGHNSVAGDKTVKYAIDDIRVYPLGENEVLVNTFELSKANGAYAANIKITNNTSADAAYKLLLCVYDKDGKMIGVKTDDITAAAGKDGENNSLSITSVGASYARLYMVYSMDSLNIKAQTMAY